MTEMVLALGVEQKNWHFRVFCFIFLVHCINLRHKLFVEVSFHVEPSDDQVIYFPDVVSKGLIVRHELVNILVVLLPEQDKSVFSLISGNLYVLFAHYSLDRA